MNILVIEDDPITLKTLQNSIENLNHKVYTAESAEEAINLVVDREIDLIISDIMMPGISGLSLVSVLRVVHLCKLPIIIMSVLNNKPLLDAAFEAGANDFMVKPFTVEGLTRVLKKYDKNATTVK